MLEQLKRVRIATAAALVASLLTISVMVAKGWSPEQIGLAAGSLLAVMSQFRRLLGPLDDTPPTPPGAIILPFAALLGLAASACTDRAALAEARYATDEAQCLDKEPTLSPSAPVAQRRAAWASYDACLADVRAHWSVKDGGP